MDSSVNPNIKCTVCGENEFDEREGFYYCMECNTKQEQVRQVEVDTGDAFNDTAGTRQHTRTIKINTVKLEKPTLTSWECYNYILRGYVEELMSFGAKEELKLMALQVWAAYLRRMEAAFFNKKQADLPKLTVRYFKSDAETIYNQSKKIRKSRKRKEGDETSCTSGEISGKSWRKNKRKLDESIYSSLTSGTSTSTNSNKAIKLTYNMKSRKILKKKMPAKHLLLHEKDGEGLLQCHYQPKVSELKRGEHQVMVMSLKQIYTVLAIALNLIGDDIQLTDLVRLTHEGHLGWRNIISYFPDNIACNAKEMLKKIEFYRYPEKYTEKFMRNHVCLLSKTIGIKKFKTPNIIALVQRYVTELCLPQVIQAYAERLINFLPPRFDIRADGFYPAYEARAMAYIIFVLKLLFGLDGHKEKRMSKAAMKVNRKIKQLNHQNTENRPLLFVWDEWVQYIEMRKVIVSHFNPAFCKQFKQCQSTSQILEQMSEDIRKRKEQEQAVNDNDKSHLLIKERMDSFKAVFDKFLFDYKETNQTSATITATTPPHIEFKTTLTPGLTYFKNILQHYENVNSHETALKIPDYMRNDFTERDMQSYLEVKPLIEYFQNNRKELKVISLGTTENRHYSGIFRPHRTANRRTCTYKACFDITEEKWAEEVAQLPVNTDFLDWKTELEPYQERYYKEKMRNMKRTRGTNSDAGITICDFDNRNTESRTIISRNDITYTGPLPDCSSEMFSENNMDPLLMDSGLLKPRRNLGKINIFQDIDDEDSLINNNETFTIQSVENESHSSELHDTSATSVQIKSEFFADTSNQNDKPLQFYISNMDCWMVFGNILMLNKLQRNQLQDKLPLNFSWLLETCAQTLTVDWSVVYEQLLVIELMFGLGIDDLDKVEDCIYINYNNPIKDVELVVNTHREIW